jgi:hypothetical protein
VSNLASNVNDPLANYFQRINPTLLRPEEGASTLPSIDIYGAWDRLAKQLFHTAPNVLDSVRATRNRFVHVVK